MSGAALFSVVQQDDKTIKILCSLAGEIWAEHYIPIIGKEQVGYMLEKFQSAKAVSSQINEGFRYYLISHKEEYIGYFSYIPREKQIFLSKIYIKSDFRGMGYGKKVFEFLKKTAKQNNLDKITLTVNKNNAVTIQAYKKCGFEITDAVIQDIGNGFFMDDYIMEKLLI